MRTGLVVIITNIGTCYNFITSTQKLMFSLSTWIQRVNWKTVSDLEKPKYKYTRPNVFAKKSKKSTKK